MDMYWVIPVVAILGYFFLRYQKIKMKQLRQGTHQDLEDVQTMVDSLKKRIESLEAIAAEPGPEQINPHAPEIKHDASNTRSGKMENMLNK